ncbi:MAG: TIGR03016 family PEP-CTERM system-associated outer membrane protein, partial [Betaproteobacteria bacterium]|nr:TIGR03016 family PEP-CTERM system-associated outer membrane protein [Betaproteobacteria bacterium]
ASITQQNISLLGPPAVSYINSTGNRTSLQTYSISPFLRRDFGTSVHAEARLTYRDVTSGGGTASPLANSQSETMDLRLNSGPAFRLQTWYVSLNRQHIHNSQAADIDIAKFSVGGRRLISSNFGVVANTGYERNHYPVTGAAAPPQGAFLTAGPEWTPTPRTRLAATVGRRHFGKTHTLDVTHRTRLTTWTATYTEDVTTTQQEVVVPTSVNTAALLEPLFVTAFPDPAARQRAVQDFIAQRGLPASLTVPLNSLTQVPFLLKRLQGSVGIQGLRNTVLANAFTQTREATSAASRGAGDFAASASTAQTGGSALWTLRVSPKTTSNVSYGYTLNRFTDTGREDRQKYLRAGITRQFLPRVTGTLSYRMLKSDSSQAGASYAENAVSAAIQVRF